MRITFEGRDWDFDLETVTLKQGVAMHLAYGFTLDSWFHALQETDPRALQCLWWLILQQNGQVMPIKDADCSLIDLSVAFSEAQDEEDAEGEPEEADPTPPSPPADPPSPGPPTPTATTPRPRARRPASARTASTAEI